MAYTTINKSTDYFNTKLYTGNGGTNAITGVGFQPDMIWCKARSYNDDHTITDVVRGNTKVVYPNNSNAEATSSSRVTAFGTDGFTLGASGDVNSNSATYASWNWKAGNSQGSSNTDGSTNTTYTSANATAGFSISTFTTPGSGTFTVGHGLGVAPKMIIYRPTGSSSWQVGHNSLGWTNFLALNNDGASSSNTAFGNTAPTTSVWTGNTANVGANAPCVAYCFAEKVGYSKMGIFTGNGNADGTFVYTGFKPAFLLIKVTSSVDSWRLFDNKRTTSFNPIDITLRPNTNDADYTASANNVDFLSNGFKMRTTSGGYNGSSDTIIYMAFGQSLVGSNNVPCTAR